MYSYVTYHFTYSQRNMEDMKCVHSCFMTMALFFFLLVVPCGSEFSCEDYSDCQTLLEFKKGVTSDPDGHLQEWNEDNAFCNWTGITCHQNQENRVIALDLADKRLEGSLSPFLSNLSLLTSLSLHTNSFHGEIPGSLGDLLELARLNLSGNNLQGQIPSSLQGCRSLKYIDLSVNSLSGVIPKELGKMKNLTYLALAENVLNGSIPSSLSNLVELTRLELAANYLTGKIPPELGELKKLEIMYLHLNFLEGSIPSEISNCTALREISLIGNLLSGKIPEEISKLKNLQKMYLHMNRLSGKIPAKLSNLSQLILLDLSRNELEGEVPMELGMLENLENLALHVNYLVSGSDNSSPRFLTALTNCTRLRRLHVGSCLFAGKLPDSVGYLSKELYHFNISNNRISGNIPENIGNLSSLVTMDFSSNLLEGSLPVSLAKLEKLQRLNLGRNRLVGVIPDEIGQMGSLGSLNLSNNLISGTIPTSLCDSAPLRYLSLSRNRLTGELPLELTECSLLMLLDLSYNGFQGPVPSEIGKLSNLALFLNLSNNNFEGEIPVTIGKLESVESLDFSNNKFSGVIPSSIASCISLEYLNFSNNMIEGPIPESLKKITYLESLDLSHNQLKGTIPAWLGTKEMMMNLNLSYNRLSGEVPKNGRFRNFSRNSFLGNLGLCGGSSQMNLPPCDGQRKKFKIRSLILYLMLPIVLGIIFFLVVAFIIWCCFLKKKDKKQESIVSRQYSSANVNWTKTYTERELEVATDGFSEENLLGIGSFGSVYRAVMDQGRTTVAVKVFHEDSSQSYNSLKRECEILSKIKHRNLVRVVGSSWNLRFKALVLEFIPNGNLERHLYPGGVEDGPCKLTLEERMSIAIDIANGLEYLQEGCPTQIVHCDLKPENVLIDYDMVAHIADFGIGKLLFDKSNEQTATTGFLRGSIGYIPPEYGQGLEVSARGDTYSFGVILLEMIARKRPTSSTFSDGLSLRQWVVSSFPSKVLDIVDTALKQKAGFGDSIRSLKRVEKCCTQVLRLALMCTEPNPHERPLMSSVVQMLLSISKDLTFEESHENQVANKPMKISEEEVSMLIEFT